MSEIQDGITGTCCHCNEPIHSDDNGAGRIIMIHDHGSTVCHDVPLGSVETGTVAELTVSADTHWHVASGLSGYGPDGSDGFDSADNPEALADAIRGELNTWAEFEFESAKSHAESGDYESAWKLREHSDSLDTLRQNLDNDRANAPLYVNDRAAWHATILRIVSEQFPLDVSEGRSRIYVWECNNGSDCEHTEELTNTTLHLCDEECGDDTHPRDGRTVPTL